MCSVPGILYSYVLLGFLFGRTFAYFWRCRRRNSSRRKWEGRLDLADEAIHQNIRPNLRDGLMCVVFILLMFVLREGIIKFLIIR